VVSAILALGMVGITGVAFADPPVAMAPPVDNPPATTTTSHTENIFNWDEIPANQQVPLNHAVFDHGGYQLYDTVGETIVVPFANQNLYVMKFAVSPNDTLYFVNEGGTPVLYIPRDGYLENATVPGAKWYPFSADFHPATPVFLGVAPSYPDYVDIGWYPNTVIYGGYYCSTPFIAGGVFLPTIGLTFIIGGHPYHGWHEFHDYVVIHPGPYHVRYFHEGIYRPYRGAFAAREFRGYAGYHGPVGFHPGTVVAHGGHVFHGGDPRFTGGGHGVGGVGGHDFHGTGGTGHVFHGGAVSLPHGSSGHVFGGTPSGSHDGGSHVFHGGGAPGGHASGGVPSGGHEFHGGGAGHESHGGGGGHEHGGH